MIDPLFTPLDAVAHAHIRDLDTGRTVGVRETEPVILVSVVKIFIAWEFRRQVEEGLIDPAETVRVTAADRLGGTGTAGFRHDATASLGDLVALMMEVSDNTAADMVVKHLGLGSLRSLPARLGLPRTRLVGGPRTVLEDVARDLGVSDLESLARILAGKSVKTGDLRRTSAWDPSRTNSSTPEDMTAFLERVWNGPRPLRDDMRRWMGRQLTGGRLTTLAPSEVRHFGRSGTLPGWFMEIAVWEWPDGRRHALAVFVKANGGRPRELFRAMSETALRLTEAVDRA
ncbi:serine hydrolase [Salininema proteolyticum]|uniref:Serine hydrolase n=1 Tax=Salininema proteolyticum TaxID=1607685 RepID=A0ABV8TUR6_9ACTN